MLSQVQSQLVAWAFYVYFVGSIIFFLVSLKVDVYRNLDTKTLSAGLLLSAFGSFMFVPAATMEFSFLPYRFIYSRTWFFNSANCC
jgi:FHS family L-fucose permease-like MFS transporter